MSISTPVNSTNEPFENSVCGAGVSYDKHYQELPWVGQEAVPGTYVNALPYGPIGTWPLIWRNLSGVTKICRFLTAGCTAKVTIGSRTLFLEITKNGGIFIVDFPIPIPATTSTGTSRVGKASLPSTLTLDPGDIISMRVRLSGGATNDDIYAITHLEWDGDLL